MKKFILLLIMAAHANGNWFDNGDKDRRMWAEQQLQQERHTSSGWAVAAGVMAIGAVTLFTIGCALGSKIRRDAKKP